VEYALTDKGSDLNPALDALRQWSAEHLAGSPPEPVTSAAASETSGRSERSDRKTEALKQRSDVQPSRPDSNKTAPKPFPALRPWGATAKARIR